MKISFLRDGKPPLEFQERVIAPPPDPTAGMVRYRVKNDTESPILWPNGVRSVAPAPAVNPVSGSKDTFPDTTRSWFTREWQFFWLDCLSLQKYRVIYMDLPKYSQPSKNIERNLIVSAWKDLTAGNKFMTDSHGTDKYRNYVTGTNMEKELPKQQSKITVSKKIGDKWINCVYSRWPVETNKDGVEMVRLDSFLAGLGPPVATLELVNNDHRMQTALIINENGSLTNFSHLKGSPIVPVRYPFVTVGEAWYPRPELEMV